MNNDILLVNKNNLITEDYIKTANLVEVINVEGKVVKVDFNTYIAFLNLKHFLADKNITIAIDSAYRSFEKQRNIYDEYIEKYGIEYANKYVAPVGASEHHTGLAIDFALDYNGENRENVFLEVHKYLKDFGFILRYPKGKEEITGYPYEPWHIRYIGIDAANYLYNNNMALEEYVKINNL